MSVSKLLLCTALVCAAVLAGHAQEGATPASPVRTLRPVKNFVTVTDRTIGTPKAEDWVFYRGNYQAWGWSALERINKGNVRNLQLVWSRAMEPGTNQATPLVYNGVMYVGHPGDVFQAIDATAGELMWEYRHPLPPVGSMRNGLGQRKRAIALYGENVYTVTWDNHVLALDARTGAKVWETDRGGDLNVSNSSGPIVANGVVIAGSTCQYAGFGCYVTGHDARTGKELWRNTMIPRPGEPGDETWAGSPYETRWMTGVWGHLTYDPELDLVYYGSSGVGPASEAQRKMPGATMAGTDTRFAVRPKTGEVVWKHQVLPRDNWDQECTFEMMTMTTPVNPDPSVMLSVNPAARGRTRKTLTGVPCKTGIAWSFDAATGEFLWARATTEQNLVKTIDSKGFVTVNEDAVLKEIGKTYHVCPTYNGGRDWPYGAYNPRSNVMYVQLANVCIDTTARADRGPQPQFVYNTTNVGKFSAGKDKVGRIDAISVETGRTLWSWETRVSNYAPILATAGGLVFNGSMDRYLRALDADKGTVLWQTRLPSQVVGSPISFAVNGRQYIAVTAGGGPIAATQLQPTPDADTGSGANAVYVFALPQ
ncbi:MAG: PQQ-binding-like beta-propeller repeat protein [Acidobacteria bacterium]|nr:PQQ-binding-like beta-propeller repeat protein [Acidobacteriota bacterium]